MRRSSWALQMLQGLSLGAGPGPGLVRDRAHVHGYAQSRFSNIEFSQGALRAPRLRSAHRWGARIGRWSVLGLVGTLAKPTSLRWSRISRSRPLRLRQGAQNHAPADVSELEPARHCWDARFRRSSPFGFAEALEIDNSSPLGLARAL